MVTDGLHGEIVDLIPLTVDHSEQLLEAATDGNLWNLWVTSVPDKDNVKAYIETALNQKEKGLSMPFVVRHKLDGEIIGSTRYCNADGLTKRLEIGYTWYAKSYQRTGVNTECKFLLLCNAFENLKTIAVEFRTHFHNEASRNAILRLGAKQDGVLRSHRLDKVGNRRDTVVFSILDNEWEGIKKSLQEKMKRSNKLN